MKKFRALIILAVLILATFVLMMGFFYVQVSGNRDQTYHTGEMLLDQISVMLDRNDEQKESLIASHKEDYITRARSVAYIIDHDPLIGADSKELQKIAKLVGVDEIYLFDIGGTIYNGTDTKYVGINLDSGEQMQFFKPMLSDKTLSLCQDITPNTTQGIPMMYAMCWSETFDRLVQVGVQPVTLMEDLEKSSVGSIVEGLLSSDGLNIVIADRETGIIEGSSDAGLNGKTLVEAGFSADAPKEDMVLHWVNRSPGVKSYCTYGIHGDYAIVISHDYLVANKNVTRGMIMMTIYVLVAIAIVTVVVRRLNHRISNEHKSANTDPMTGFFNRRAYESEVLFATGNPLSADSVYVSMDLNGLKDVNDSKGHDAGDKLIIGAAECMKAVLSKYGSIYRIGGDEFAAIIYPPPFELEDLRIQLKKRIKTWAEENKLPLAVSCGFVKVADHPDTEASEIARIADAEMYREKEEYYKETGHERRGHRRVKGREKTEEKK